MAEPIPNQPHSTLSPSQEAFDIDSFLKSAPPPRRRKHSLPSLIEQPVFLVEIQALQHQQNGDAANHRILQEDQLDIQAARTCLGKEISRNALNVQHYRWIIKKLLDHMLQNPKNVPHRASFARILQRLLKRLTTLMVEPQSQRHASRRHRLSHVEYLTKLLQDLEKGFVVMQQRGSEDEVYLVTDVQELDGNTAHLKSLVSHLLTDRH